MAQDDDDFLYDMFGDKGEDNAMKQATRVVAGLKIHGSHQQDIMVNGQNMKVPTIQYVEQLEVQVKQLRQELRVMHSNMNRLIRQFNQSIDTMNVFKQQTQVELSKKMDQNFL